MKFSSNRFIKIFLSLVVVIIIYSSCKKEYKRYPIVLIPDEVHSMFLFDSGSYWIYADTFSGDIDTIRVISSHDDTLTQIQHKFFGETASSHFETNASGLDNEFNNETFSHERTSDSLTIGVMNDILLSYPFKVGDKHTSQYYNGVVDTSIIDSVFNSYSINNLQFGKTIEVTVKNDWGYYGWTSKYYFAEGVGLIRYIHNGNHSLISYHIE